MPLEITFAIDEPEWTLAAEAAAELLPSGSSLNLGYAGGEDQRPFPSCEDAWPIGPVTEAAFVDGAHRVGYFGSLIYLACGLTLWTPDQDAFVLPGESAFQSPDVEFTRDGDAVLIIVRSVQRPEPLRSSPNDLQAAIRSFAEDFGQALAIRIPALRGVYGLG
jgi:hypothetical protein